MANPILVGLIGAIISITGVYSYAQYSQTFGALPVIQSAQLAANPANGECLTTDGTNNDWATCSGAGGGLSSYDAWTHPASGISATTSGMVFNSASSTFVGQLRAGHFFGNLTGQSSTTLALAANGTNCSAGNFPLGVDASGAVETCTDAWTEAENTAAAYLSTVDISANTNLTAGDGLTLTNDDIDCDTASGSVFGCLSTTDWTTFNSKLSSYNAWTHPASSQSATTSLLFMAGVVSTASSTINGNLNILGNATATSATTTNLYVTNPPVFSTLTSALLLTGSTGLLAEYTGIGCTNQVVEDVSALGAGTCVSINNGYWSGTDLSVANGGTGLSTFGSTNTVLYTTAADALSSEAAFTYDAAQDLLTVASTSITKATSTNLTVTATASSSALVISNSIRLFGGTVYSTLATLGNALVNAVTAVTPTGTWDFGGATSLEIVNGSSPTVDAIGEIAVDTTANELLYGTTTNSGSPAVLKPYRTYAFSYGSSTQGVGTTTRSLGPTDAAGYFHEIQCDFNNFMRVMLYDGTNRMDDLIASSTIGTVRFTQNQTFTSGEAIRVDIGTTTASLGNVFGGCRAKYIYTRN